LIPQAVPSVEDSPGFLTFAQCFCINPVFIKGHFRKQKGWVLIDLGTGWETNFKTMRDAKHHLLHLYLEAVPKKIAPAGC
jgi:hypothetical protein